MDTNDELEESRRAYGEQAWRKAYDAFVAVDHVEPLESDDLECLARSAYMLGRDDDYVAHLERAYQKRLEADQVPGAVRCAFWMGHSFLFRGEPARANGWFARAERHLAKAELDCVEHGYLKIPAWLELMRRGDFERGYATAVEAAEIAERFGDADLLWLARDEQARALMHLGRVQEALRLLDETLVAAGSGELSPIVTGIVYCNTIAFCRARYEMRHVREWTQALSRWCERQPEMIAHNGLCLVHRAEIKLLHGEWQGALEEARRSAERFSAGALNQLARGEAFYCQGEVHRLRGATGQADEAYRQALQHGREPQPGLALLRLAQGKADAAAAAIRRVVGETTAPLRRAALLPAYVEIMLATGELDLARAACRELEDLRATLGCEVVDAMAAHARGALLLAEERPSEALIELRRASTLWVGLTAGYDVARIRVRVGLACRALGDEDTAVLEMAAARRTFDELGAVPDCAWVDALGDPAKPGRGHGLTGRELQVLRRVAAGKSNREIAEELVISEHTVARHIQNIFAKLDVSSRTAATAFAFAHDLV